MRRIFQLSVGVVLTEDLTWALGLVLKSRFFLVKKQGMSRPSGMISSYQCFVFPC